jgi:hypothetical protein
VKLLPTGPSGFVGRRYVSQPISRAGFTLLRLSDFAYCAFICIDVAVGDIENITD